LSANNLTSDLFALLNGTEFAPVVALLNDTTANVTLFAPVNSAFTNPPEIVDLNLVLYHAISGAVVTSGDLADGLNFATSALGSALEINVVDGTVQIIFGIPGNNDTTATVTEADILASNGVVHLIDTILVPPANVSVVANNSGILDGLVANLIKADLVDTVDSLKTTTIFAPMDMNAIANLSVDALTTTLYYHVIESVIFSTDITEGSFTTASGDNLTISVVDGVVMLNDKASVVVANILTATGVVHVIDQALLVEPSLTRTVTENIALDPTLTTIASLIVADQELTAAVNSPNTTLFAPTNDALAAVDVNNETDLTAILSYHVISSFVNGSALAPVAILDSELADPVWVNLNGSAQVVELLAQGPTVNKVATVNGSLYSLDSSVAHIIDTVLIPPGLTSDIATANNLTTLVDAVVLTNLTTAVNELPSLTIFAPNNEGFANYLESQNGANLTSLNRTDLTWTLLGHVIDGVAYSTDLVDGDNVTMLDNKTYTIEINSEGQVSVGGAKVLVANVLTQNGVVHVIDRVIGGPGPNSGGLSTGAVIAIVVAVLVVFGLIYVGSKQCKSSDSSGDYVRQN
jgi:uncharacterized surface protein with fasciclin (FAS1) repeats